MIDGISYFMGQDGFRWFVGVVESRDDPEHAGRVKVRCVGFHSDDTQKIKTEHLPWASVMMPVTAGGNSGIGVSPHFLLEGTWVLGFFRDPAMQEPIILGALPGKNATPENQTATIAGSYKKGGHSTKGGFRDPSGTYPTSSYIGKPDTNLLAQNDQRDTDESNDFSTRTALHASYPVKGGSEIDDKVHTKWSYFSGATKSPTANPQQQVPSTQETSTYPFNHVFESESGHYVEFDDTAGSERIHVYHRKGTFIEIDKDGHIILKTPDYVNLTTIIGGNSDTYIKGNYSLTVDGNMNIHCTGEETRPAQESDSSTTSTTTTEASADADPLGTVTHVISKGHLYETITEGNRETTITAGTETVDIKGAIIHTYQDTLTETVTKAVSQTYSDTLTMVVEKAVSLTYNDTLALTVAKDVTETFSAALKTTITGTTDIDSTGAMTIKSAAALTAEAAAAATFKGSTISFN